MITATRGATSGRLGVECWAVPREGVVWHLCLIVTQILKNEQTGGQRERGGWGVGREKLDYIMKVKRERERDCFLYSAEAHVTIQVTQVSVIYIYIERERERERERIKYISKSVKHLDTSARPGLGHTHTHTHTYTKKKEKPNKFGDWKNRFYCECVPFVLMLSKLNVMSSFCPV